MNMVPPLETRGNPTEMRSNNNKKKDLTFQTPSAQPRDDVVVQNLAGAVIHLALRCQLPEHAAPASCQWQVQSIRTLRRVAIPEASLHSRTHLCLSGGETGGRRAGRAGLMSPLWPRRSSSPNLCGGEMINPALLDTQAWLDSVFLNKLRRNCK